MSASLRIFLFSFVVASYANFLGAWLAPSFSMENLGPVALAWHDRPVLIAFAPAILIGLGLIRVRGAARTGLIVLLGAVLAQAVTRLSLGSTPDYFVLRAGGTVRDPLVDLMFNVPDLMIALTTLVLVLIVPFKSLRQS